MEFIIYAVIAIGPVIVGYIFGNISEKKHYQSIQKREAELINLPSVPMQHAWDESAPIRSANLVVGGVVISNDYFKSMIANLTGFFGGRMIGYESLIDRARREALIRMKEHAKGSDVIVNTKIETVPIGENAGSDRSPDGIEALAYGTAITYQK